MSSVMRGGPWMAAEREAILDYCESDVTALERLLTRMAPAIDLPRALVRGRYMAAAACIEWNGVPIDASHSGVLRNGWNEIKARLIEEVDADYGVFDGCTFKLVRFEQYLARRHPLAPPCERSARSVRTIPFVRSPEAEPRVAHCGSCATAFRKCAQRG